MSELVFLEPNNIDAVPFTTSKVISEVTGVSHRHVKKQIRQRENELGQFGLLVAHETESSGGRPEEVTRLNEQQATLLITFLKNTPVVIAFKVELVRQFFAMRFELSRRHMERAQLKPVRREMTDVIQQVDDDRWAYKKFTDLAYIAVTGKIAKKLREERGAHKDAVAIDYLTADEIHAVAEMQYSIAVLLEAGMDYQQIKAALSSLKLDRAMPRLTA